jgi:DNA-binding NtrC family response regulator
LNELPDQIDKRIKLSSLRDRAEKDIPSILAGWRKEMKEFERLPVLNDECMRYLIEQDWPGNVSQLKRIAQKLTTASKWSREELEKLIHEDTRQLSRQTPDFEKPVISMTDPDLRKIMELIQDREEVKTSDLVRMLDSGISRSTVILRLNKLREQGVLELVRKGRNSYYRVVGRLS